MVYIVPRVVVEVISILDREAETKPCGFFCFAVALCWQNNPAAFWRDAPQALLNLVERRNKKQWKRVK